MKRVGTGAKIRHDSEAKVIKLLLFVFVLFTLSPGKPVLHSRIINKDYSLF